jgi:hypothetical protein
MITSTPVWPGHFLVFRYYCRMKTACDLPITMLSATSVFTGNGHYRLSSICSMFVMPRFCDYLLMALVSLVVLCGFVDLRFDQFAGNANWSWITE